MGTDHIPLAHRWNIDPPIQFHAPSGEHAEPAVLPPALFGAIVGAGDEGAAAEGEGAGFTGGGDGSAGGEDGAAGAADAIDEVAGLDGAAVANTPGDGCADVGATAGAADPLPWPAIGPVPSAFLHTISPGFMRRLGSPANSSEEPGFGNAMSIPSVVMQPLMFATNMSGRSSRFERETRLAGLARSEGAYLFFVAPVTTIGAQFMYISRFPMRFHHAHPSVYRPGAILSGILNWKVLAPLPLGSAGRFPSVFAGHPPSME
jgi:hypothetical protein